MGWSDLVGIVGVVLVLSAYALLQLGKWRPEQTHYSAANAAGAALILVSLRADFNLSAALIEFAWLLISTYGVCRSLRRRLVAR